MKKLSLALVCTLIAAIAPAAEIPPAETQIAAAIQAAPQDRRDGAGVLGYDSSGKLVTLKEAQNDLICLADNPTDDRWSVACYHESLEPFMARGRELIGQGITGPERRDLRFKEIDDKKLDMPREPRTLYVLSGSGYEGGEVEEAYLRWVIYLPYATAESTGLSEKPGPNAPWLMDAGTAGAHIMITPPRN